MKLTKKIQYKYLQKSYKPKKKSIISKGTLDLIDDMEKYLGKKFSTLLDGKELKENDDK